jgi:hypothetical protein
VFGVTDQSIEGACAEEIAINAATIANKTDRLGKGYVENVTLAMWAYEVPGKEVIWHWFSYRRRDRGCPMIGDKHPPSPLDSIQLKGWRQTQLANKNVFVSQLRVRAGTDQQRTASAFVYL